MDLSVPDQGERNYFQVSIYCDQPKDLPTPRADHYRLVRSIMDRQTEQVRNTIWCLFQLSRDFRDGTKHGFAELREADKYLARGGLRRRLLNPADVTQFDPHLQSLHAVPQRIRALYGMMRSGFSVGTISRLPSYIDDMGPDQPYGRFRGWLRAITNAAAGWDEVTATLFPDDTASHQWEDFWRVIDPDGKAPEKPPLVRVAKPLYRDEIGWLLNEQGLIAQVQGCVFDSLPLFQRALDEMHHNDNHEHDDPSLHAAVRRVRLNMAIALIDRGQLGRARVILSDLVLPVDFSSHYGSQVSWISKGYLGLVDHLSGNQETVAKVYEEIVKAANERRMFRLVAIFSKHWADLLRKDGDYEGARRRIDIAISAATESEQRDVLYLAKLSAAHISLLSDKSSEQSVGEAVRDAIEFAQSMGIPRLECQAHKLHAEVMLRQGEKTLAGTLAMRSAAIANRNGLRLHKLQAMKLYGAALVGRHDFHLAEQVLRETRREAERRGYQSLARGLADEMSRLPVHA